MDENHARGHSLVDPLASDVVRRLAETVARVIPFLVLVAAAILLSRRISGALVRPLQPSLLVGVAATAALAVWLWAICQDSSRAQRVRTIDRVFAIALAVALMTLGACLSLPGTRPLALAIGWILLLGSLWPLYAVLRTARPGQSGSPWRDKLGRARDRGPISSSSPSPRWREDRSSPTVEKTSPKNHGTDRVAPLASNMCHDVDVIESVDQLDSDLQRVTQRLTRMWSAEDGESIYGTMRASFTPNQRDAVLHVAFCPSFTRVPQLDVQQQEGPEAQLKIGQLLAYGARIDVRLREAPPEATSVVVELSVRETPAEDN